MEREKTCCLCEMNIDGTLGRLCCRCDQIRQDVFIDVIESGEA